MPISFALIFRGLILLALAAHVFYMYCTARGLGGHFGFDPGTTTGSSFFALAMLVPLVWAVFLPDLPEFITQHVRPRRRWSRGQCPQCGYDRLSLPADEKVCPECGGELREPEAWRFTVRTVQRFVAINLIAWLVGCFAGELWMENDERDFRAEVTAQLKRDDISDRYRQRRWPNHSETMAYRYAGRYEMVTR